MPYSCGGNYQDTTLNRQEVSRVRTTSKDLTPQPAQQHGALIQRAPFGAKNLARRAQVFCSNAHHKILTPIKRCLVQLHAPALLHAQCKRQQRQERTWTWTKTEMHDRWWSCHGIFHHPNSQPLLPIFR